MTCVFGAEELRRNFGAAYSFGADQSGLKQVLSICALYDARRSICLRSVDSSFEAVHGSAETLPANERLPQARSVRCKTGLGLAPDYQMGVGDDLAGLDDGGAPASIAATVMVSAIENEFRSDCHDTRERFLADGTR